MTRADSWGGYSALYLAASYILGFALFLGLVERAGYSGPQGNLAMVLDQSVLFSFGITLLYPLAACALVVLVVTMYRREAPSGSAFAQIAAVFGCLWAGLLFASGFVGIVGIQTVGSLAPEHPQVASSAWTSVAIVQDALGGGIELVGGVWMAMVSWLGLKSGLMARWLAWTGIAIGVVGMATMLPPLIELADIFGLGQILWFAGIGIALLRGGRARNLA